MTRNALRAAFSIATWAKKLTRQARQPDVIMRCSAFANTRPAVRARLTATLRAFKAAFWRSCTPRKSRCFSSTKNRYQRLQLPHRAALEADEDQDPAYVVQHPPNATTLTSRAVPRPARVRVDAGAARAREHDLIAGSARELVAGTGSECVCFR